MSDQPEALRLAEQLKERFGGTVPTSQAAACLRRQRAEIEQLRRINQAHEMRLSVRGYEIQIADLSAEIAALKAQLDALRAELLNIGDLDKRNSIVRESGLEEWADWAQNRARHVAWGTFAPSRIKGGGNG